MTIHAHTIERSDEGTQYVQQHHEKLSANCRKLIAYWQDRNYWLSEDDARKFVGVRNLRTRVSDIAVYCGIPIEKVWDSSKLFKRYRLRCTCYHVGGTRQTVGCILHDETLKISNP